MKTKGRRAGVRRTRPPGRTAAGRRGVRALGYASVPGSLALDGPEVDAQRRTIEDVCKHLGLDLLDLIRDHEPEATGAGERPGLLYALERLDAGEAGCLVVSDLERLSHQVPELAELVDRLEREGTRLIAVNLGLDTSTPSGRLAVSARPVAPLPLAPAIATVPEPTPEVEAVPSPPSPETTPGPVDEAPSAPKQAPAPAQTDRDRARPTPAPPQTDGDRARPTPKQAPATPQTDHDRARPTPEREQPPETAKEAAGQGDDGAGMPATRETVRALGYASVPSNKDGGGGELDVQRRAIERTCQRLGFELVEVVREREPRDGKALDRAGLSYLIGRIAAGEASCIVVTSLDRLSRSVSELGTLVQWLERNEVRLVAEDLSLDTATPGGRTTARALASVGGWERERLSERTRKGLAAARAKRHAGSGPSAPDWTEIRKRIAAMRADGMTLQAIADVLNEEGVPTQRGGKKWRPSSVQTAAGYKRRTKPRKVDDLPAIRQPTKGNSGTGDGSPPAPPAR